MDLEKQWEQYVANKMQKEKYPHVLGFKEWKEQQEKKKVEEWQKLSG